MISESNLFCIIAPVFFSLKVMDKEGYPRKVPRSTPSDHVPKGMAGAVRQPAPAAIFDTNKRKLMVGDLKMRSSHVGNFGRRSVQ